MLESYDDIIGIADDDYVAGSAMLSPVLNPQIENVVQVDVGQQR
jgi:hypothetical protein